MIFDVSDEEDKTVVMMNYERCRWMQQLFAVEDSLAKFP